MVLQLKGPGRQAVRQIWVPALCALALAGCARTVREGPPGVNYQPDADYHVLMAEIAMQRGVYPTAAQEYLTATEQSDDSAIARRATEFAFDYGYDRFALRSADRWQALEPDSTLAQEFLGRLYLRRNDVAQATQHFARVLGPWDQRSGDDYLALGADLSDEPGADAVLRLLLRLREGRPVPPGYRLAVAEAAYRAGAWDLAREYARQAAAAGSFEAAVLSSRVAFASGDADSALAQLAEMVSEQPTIGLQLELVRMLAASRREALAIQLLGEMFARYGEQPELVGMRALISLGLGDLGQAEADLGKSVADGYNVYESFYLLGEIAASRGESQQAIDYFQRIGAGAYLLPAQGRIAAAYVALGEVETGLAHLDEFAVAYPRYGYEIITIRASLLQQLDRLEEAIASYDEALVYKSAAPELLVTRGILKDRLGRRSAAIADMRQAVAVAPDDAEALNSLGYTLALADADLDEAYRYVRRAVERQTANAAILDSMGWILFLRGEVPAALSWLELAHRSLPDPEVAAHLGEALWTNGDRDDARRIWQEALIRYPDSQPLQDTVARFPR